MCKHYRLATVSVYTSPSTNANDCLDELGKLFTQFSIISN